MLVEQVNVRIATIGQCQSATGPHSMATSPHEVSSEKPLQKRSMYPEIEGKVAVGKVGENAGSASGQERAAGKDGI